MLRGRSYRAASKSLNFKRRYSPSHWVGVHSPCHWVGGRAIVEGGKLHLRNTSSPSALSSLLISRDAIGPCSTCPSSISSSSSSIDCMKESIRVSRIQMPHAHILGYHDTTLLVYILSHAVIKVYTTNASLFKCQCYSIYMATYPRVVLQCQNKFCVCVVTWS